MKLPEQLAQLTTLFQLFIFLSPLLQVWFSNRRAKWRREEKLRNQKREPGASSSSSGNSGSALSHPASSDTPGLETGNGGANGGHGGGVHHHSQAQTPNPHGQAHGHPQQSQSQSAAHEAATHVSGGAGDHVNGGGLTAIGGANHGQHGRSSESPSVATPVPSHTPTSASSMAASAAMAASRLPFQSAGFNSMYPSIPQSIGSVADTYG